MRIRSVEAVPVRMGVASLDTELGLAPYVSNHDSVESVDRVLVRVETATGRLGWGEMLVALKSARVTKTVVEDVIAPELEGVAVTEARSALAEFYYPYVRLDPFLGAVSTAIWDLVGKQYGAPIVDLLGGAVTESVPVAFCLGIMDPERAADHAVEAKSAGFARLKTKAGPDWNADVERLTAMDRAVDGALEFRLDPNQGWTATEAVRALTRLEERGILLEYIEQPLRTETPGSFAKLRARVNTPIAVNEDTYFRGNLATLLRHDAIDVAVIDLVPAGGITAARDQVAEASAAGVSVSHHCGFDLGVKTAAVLHLAAGTPALNLPPDSVYYGWDEYVLEDPFELRDGAYSVPDGPGLGVTVDEDEIKRYRLDK
ncbi:mandelate racemase/muconate lactonizing enzyme family protein [Halosolutus gelatinilyticus]|uniref:mandelate racemase/muconate lactonizing enzyme family protein n=1 Tax=Halosolutus gelatinilyticus TaxID=2931975 RepID=UPI001FF2D909|nr:mandelate racemase/muconate lactonizing enzyme family protein [Halosolutus gelatinilyticus]